MRVKTVRVERKFNLGNYESRGLMVEVDLDNSFEFNLPLLQELEAKLVEGNLTLEQNKQGLIKSTQEKILRTLGINLSQNGENKGAIKE